MTREEANIYLESVFPVLNAKMQEAIKALCTEQESIEVEATELQKSYNKGFDSCKQAVLEIFGYVMSYWKEHAIDVEPHEIEDALIEQYEFTAKQLSELTPVTPQEPKDGHWITDLQTSTEDYYICSNCGHKIHLIYPDTFNNYPDCPNCRAKMIKEKESEE